jgi:hypothetical protein
VFIEWWATGSTKIRVNGDVAEARQFVSRNTCITLGARYSLAYGALGDSARFESQSAGIEAGAETGLGQNLFARVKLKESFWGDDSARFDSGAGRAFPLRRFASLRLVLAYAL